MNKRLAMLEQLTTSGKADSFAWYALALEYRSMGRIDDALRAFTSLREQDSDYVPAYQMAGSMLASEGRTEEARTWLEAGIVVARASGQDHARAEMQEMLDGLN